MEISTNLKLCLLLVSSAINRCRLSQNLCRLSVSVKRFSSPTVFRVSISDTGIGSCVEEFKSFKCAHGFIAGNNSDGVLSIATTRISDDEVRNYQINLMETVPARRLCVLPSQPKHGGRFSGTEVSFATAQDISGLLPEIACFLKKVIKTSCKAICFRKPGEVSFSVLYGFADANSGDSCMPRDFCEEVFSVHFQKDSIDVMVQHYIELIREDPVVANGCDPPPDASNIERLKSGLEDYVLRHGNKSDTKCLSCFPDHRDHLKVGSGMAYCMERQRNAGLIVEAVVVISDSIDPSSPCFREFGTNTEVVLFNDFSPSLLTQTSQNALTKMDWKCYGLTLGNVLDLDGHALLEWEKLPPSVHIDIVLHCYQSLAIMPSARKTSQFEHCKLVKKALGSALEDIKERHAGILLSANAVKVCSYAPELAKTVAGLILCSDNSDFQGECMKLLGLCSPQDQTNEKESIEACVNEKILKAISLHDKRNHRGKDPAPLLFEDEDEGFLEPDFSTDEEDL